MSNLYHRSKKSDRIPLIDLADSKTDNMPSTDPRSPSANISR